MENAVAAIILASGWSADGRGPGRPGPSENGPPDALRPVDGGVALSVVLRTLQAVPVSRIVAVLGRDAAAIRERVQLDGVTVVELSSPEPMIESVRAGLRALPPEATAALIWPVDRALVAIRTARMLLAAHDAGARLAVPVCTVPGDDEGRRGHPVLFDRSLFAELAGAAGAEGAAAVVHAHEADLTPVEVEDRGILADVGSPEVQAMLARLKAEANGFTGSDLGNGHGSSPRRRRKDA